MGIFMPRGDGRGFLQFEKTEEKKNYSREFQHLQFQHLQYENFLSIKSLKDHNLHYLFRREDNLMKIL